MLCPSKNSIGNVDRIMSFYCRWGIFSQLNCGRSDSIYSTIPGYGTFHRGLLGFSLGSGLALGGIPYKSLRCVLNAILDLVMDCKPRFPCLFWGVYYLHYLLHLHRWNKGFPCACVFVLQLIREGLWRRTCFVQYPVTLA